jgi:ATP-dependent Clp protease ATP-binding subunit ClpC
MGTLVAGTKYRGTFEERLKEIVKEAQETPGIVLFIDEIHTLVGAGRTEGGSLDAANILKPALARGEINVIGATTVSEYRKHFESDSALERRFQPIRIEEPSAEATVVLLSKLRHQYEEHHEVSIDLDALEAATRLAIRYVPERRLPDKALDLLDESCAEVSLSGGGRVTTGVVASVVSEHTGVPVHDLTAQERERLMDLEQQLAERVIGQGFAVGAVASAVRLARSGLRDPRRPRGVFLFAGTSGVGKTELARALADFLFPEGNNLIKLDMSEYGEKFTSSRLVGAPPGYSGHGEEGQLSGPLRTRPYSVVLLDEFDKAHTDVAAMFLSLFDEGVLTDSEGRTVHAREAFFVLTTNAGATGRGRLGFGSDAASVRNSVLARIRERFRPELLNRIDDIVVFDSLTRPNLRAIADLQLSHLATRAREQGVDLTWDRDVADLCALHQADERYGARPTLRAVESLVGEPLGKLILERRSNATPGYRARLRGGAVVLEEAPLARPQEQPPEYEPV